MHFFNTKNQTENIHGKIDFTFIGLEVQLGNSFKKDVQIYNSNFILKNSEKRDYTLDSDNSTILFENIRYTD